MVKTLNRGEEQQSSQSTKKRRTPRRRSRHGLHEFARILQKQTKVTNRGKIMAGQNHGETCHRKFARFEKTLRDSSTDGHGWEIVEYAFPPAGGFGGVTSVTSVTKQCL